MKPLATLNRPVLKTVDVETNRETVSFREQTDVTASRRASWPGLVALVLASEALRKFGGGPSRVRPPRRVSGVAPVSDGAHLVLVGLMGAGKTTVGTECAARLGRPFVDTDELVVAFVGGPFDDIWSAEGERGFRLRERLAVADAAASPTPLVIAGGDRRRPRQPAPAARAGTVVWLRRSCSRRAGRSPTAPALLPGDPVVALGRLEAARGRVRNAHVAVDTSDRDVDEVASAVLEAYERARP
jgi:shikimate kinase